MAIEIEKKYILDESLTGQLSARLDKLAASFDGEVFEVNYLHGGGILDNKAAVLRLRKTGDTAVLTYKERISGNGDFKQQTEFETGVTDVEAAENIIERLGYKVEIIYEKRRRTWQLGRVEVVLDELPFGLYMEIEGDEEEILKAEKQLQVCDVEVEPRGYPTLTLEYGTPVNGVFEARFGVATAI